MDHFHIVNIAKIIIQSTTRNCVLNFITELLNKPEEYEKV